MEFKYKITLDIKKESLLVGWLYSNAGRKEIISFEYVDLYLQNMHFVNIDPLLSKRTGRQFPPTHKNNFGFVEDISPDRWGRNLLKKMIAHTPSNIEAGDPSVGFGLYAMALHMLGLATELDLIGAPERDEMGNLINEADLPKRIRRS